MSDDNTNSYMVTVKASAGGEMEMVDVTVMVTDVDELDGTLAGDARPDPSATWRTAPMAVGNLHGLEGGDGGHGHVDADGR